MSLVSRLIVFNKDPKLVSKLDTLRSIGVPSVLLKLYEQIIQQRMMASLEAKNNQIHPNQMGFT